MSFRFYTSAISQASKAVAAGIFVTGLSLVGFGVMIYLLPRLFATLAAVIFFVAGLGCLLTAVKVFLARQRFRKSHSDESQGYRENVKIHIEEHYEA
jgi:protein-S-isoprenylcysteine O-methyltransferase Ste14